MRAVAAVAAALLAALAPSQAKPAPDGPTKKRVLLLGDVSLNNHFQHAQKALKDQAEVVRSPLTLAERAKLALSGTVVLVFVVAHLLHFKFGPHYDVALSRDVSVEVFTFKAGTKMRDLHRVGVELFGVELFSKTFDDVTRAWDQTFVDEEFRVVRAARTLEALAKANARGRRAVAGDEDDCVFVMRRRERRG